MATATLGVDFFATDDATEQIKGFTTRSQPTRNGALGGPLGALPKPLGSERLDDLMFVCASLYLRGHTRTAKVSLG